MEIVLVTIILGATVILAFFITKVFKSQQKDTELTEEPLVEENDNDKKSKSSPHESNEKSKKKFNDKKMKEKVVQFSHPWLLSTLKGHSGRVLDLDLSPNGKYLASCAEDRTVLVWQSKDFTAKEHKILRCNVEYDHGLFIRWSPDSKAFVVQKAVQNCTEVYKMGKKPDGSLGDFSVAVSFPPAHKTDTVGMGISSSGRFIASCSDKTDLIIWNLKGEILDKIDTVHNLTYCCQVSPCGRFVATSGFTSDVKFWEVKFTRSGDFDKVTRAFHLSGHTSGVYNFSFSADCSKVATVSKDGSWKVFNIAIEYSKGQDADVIITGDYTGDGIESSKPSQIMISPNGKVVAIHQEKRVNLYSVLTGELVGSIQDPHTQPIVKVLFSADSEYLFTAGDKHIRIFHNVPGIQSNIQELKLTLKKNLTNSTAKERIEQQIKLAEENLKNIVS